MPFPAAAAITGGASIAQGLIGKHATNKAANVQAKAAGRAEKDASGDRLQQTVMDDYAMQRAAEADTRDRTIKNALLESYGVTGLPDPNVAPPPSLVAMAKGQQPGVRDRITLGALAGINPDAMEEEALMAEQDPRMAPPSGSPLDRGPLRGRVTLGSLAAMRR